MIPAEISASARRLLRVVYTMGVIMVLLFLLLIGAIIWKATRKPEVKPDPATTPVSLGLPQGSEIRSATLDGDRLVIVTATQVFVVDVRKNQLISRVTATP